MTQDIFAKLASINHHVLEKIAEPIPTEAYDKARTFVENIPNNDVIGAAGGALLGREIGKRTGHKNLGTVLGGAAGYAASGNWGAIGDSLKEGITNLGEAGKGALEGAKNLGEAIANKF